jgi:peptidoglycan/xylan/chitin deacetylase (PgdA/CDA1 family)
MVAMSAGGPASATGGGLPTIVGPIASRHALTKLEPPVPRFIRSGPLDRPRVALSVDDIFGAAGADNASALMDIGEQKNVRFTFFPTGGAIADHIAAGRQAVWQRAVIDGHEIGNHTYTHANLTKLTDQQIRDELNRTNDVLEACLGLSYPYTMRLMRPPGGAGGFVAGGDPRIMNVVTSLGYSMAMWTIDSNGTAGNASFAAKILATVGNGGIVLCHFSTFAVSNFPSLIDRLRGDRHLEPTNISGLFTP